MLLKRQYFEAVTLSISPGDRAAAAACRAPGCGEPGEANPIRRRRRTPGGGRGGVTRRRGAPGSTGRRGPRGGGGRRGTCSQIDAGSSNTVQKDRTLYHSRDYTVFYRGCNGAGGPTPV